MALFQTIFTIGIILGFLIGLMVGIGLGIVYHAFYISGKGY